MSLRVAYVLPGLQNPSGWRSHARGFLNAIRAWVDPVLFVAQQDEAEARRIFPELQVVALPTTQRASLSSLSGLQLLLRCYQHIRRGRYPMVDLVHSLEAYPTGLVGHWLARRLEAPHLLTSHGTYGVIWWEKPLDRWFYQVVLRRSAMICPVSHGTAQRMQACFGAAMKHTTVKPILNGNDYWQRVPRSLALHRSAPAIPTLLSVGDVKPRKGYHVSLRAFAVVKSHLPSARYFIVGRYEPNRYYQQLEGLVHSLGLQDVTFCGAISDEEMSLRYQQASVFVLAPQPEGLQFEGFGLVFLEAGAYGLPVAATRTGGVPEAVLDGETGFLVEADDVDGLARAALRLLTDAALANRLGQANRRRAETLTWERNAAEHLEAYQQVLGRV